LIFKLLNGFSVELRDCEKRLLISRKIIENEADIEKREILLEKIGIQIFNAIFTGEVKRQLDQLYGQANQNNIHIQIEYEHNEISKSKISLYPWHLAYDTSKNGFMVKEGRAIFSYLIAHNDPPINLINKENVTIFHIVSDAQDSESNLTSIQSSESEIEKEIKSSGVGKTVTLYQVYDKSQRRTFEHLSSVITKYQQNSSNIIHFEGHSVFRKFCSNCFESKRKSYTIQKDKCEECQQQLEKFQGFLLFETDKGNPYYISASDFVDLTIRLKPTLVLLSSCRSALAHGSNSVFNGIAQGFIQKGVPAVIGSPFLITDDGSRHFISSFYENLFNNKSLLECLHYATKSMKHHDQEWYRHIIFMRYGGTEDGRLFNFKKEPMTNGGMPLRPEDYLGIITAYTKCCLLAKQLDIIIKIFKDIDIKEPDRFDTYISTIDDTDKIFNKIPDFSSSINTWLERIPISPKAKEEYQQAYGEIKNFIDIEKKRTRKKTSFKISNVNSSLQKLEDFWWDLLVGEQLREYLQR